MKLPKFKFHPDPFKTSMFEKSENKCLCCGKDTGIIYAGPVHTENDAEETLDSHICPWCIADGSVHTKFDAEFIDPDSVGARGRWDDIPKEQVEEIAYRTPGYFAWQEALWWTHCNEGAEFIGLVGKNEIIQYGDDFLHYIREEAEIENKKDWENYLDHLDKEGSPTAYVFRCRKCGKFGGYSDSH